MTTSVRKLESAGASAGGRVRGCGGAAERLTLLAAAAASAAAAPATAAEVPHLETSRE
jgi:hypothetical protein